MAVQVLSDMSAFLREWFVSETAEIMSYRSAPLFSWLQKNASQDGAGGSQAKFPLVSALGGGASATFSSAQSDTSTSTATGFVFPWTKHYAAIQLDRLAMMATTPAGKKAIMEKLKVEIEAKTRLFKETLNAKLYRNGTGSRGQRASVSSNTITLVNAHDAHCWEVGMTLVAASSETGALRAGSTTVTKVTRPYGTATAGSITVASAAAITSFADNDYLFISGDAQAGASAPICPYGLDALFPTSDPGGSDSFGGINRSQDPVRLAGVRVDGAQLSVRDALIQLVEDTMDVPSAIFTHPNVITALKRSENNSVRYTEVTSSTKAKLSFNAVAIDTAKGVIPIIGDRHCFVNRAYALHAPTLYLSCVNPQLPDFVVGDDGQKIIMPSSDGYEIRLTGYMAFGSTAPGNNGVAFNLSV